MLARERIVNQIMHFDQCLCGFWLIFPSRFCCLFCDLAALFWRQAFGPGFAAFSRTQLRQRDRMGILDPFGFRFRSIPFLADDILHNRLGKQDGIARGLRRFLRLACSGGHGTIMACFYLVAKAREPLRAKRTIRLPQEWLSQWRIFVELR